MTSTPVYPEAPTCPPPEHPEAFGKQSNPPSPDLVSPGGSVSLGGRQADPDGGVSGAAARGAQPPTCEEREISTRFGSTQTAEAQVGAGKEASRSENAKSSEARTARWQALGLLWDMSSLARVRKCGRVAILPGGQVGVRKKSEAVGYAGLASCGSVWACPRCSARIMAVRRLELGVLIAGAAAAGMTVAFGTVTLRHRQGQPLAQLWDALSQGQRGVTNATKVKRIRQQLGRVGYVRATEVTYGGHGWHPHVHTIQLFEGDVSQEQLDELRDAEFAVWRRQAVNRGLGAPMKKRYELRRVVDADVEFSDYFVKGVYNPSVARAAKSVGFEMTGSQTKKGRGSRTPWQVLEDFGRTGDLDDWDVFQEYEQASKGKRALVWSNGLKKMFGIGEIEDEQIADEEIGDQDDTLFWVTDWGPIAADALLGGRLLGAVRAGGLSGGLAFCRKHEIPTSVGSPDGGQE